MTAPQPPLVVHLIYRFRLGGMENGLVNLINHTPPDHCRHAIVCLTESSALENSIRRPGTPVIALGSDRGFTATTYARLVRTLRRLRPAVVHTRNLGCIEGQLCAALAGVAVRIHGEHGRDLLDPDGASRKYNRMRRLLRPLTHRFTAVSRDLAGWLVETIGVKPERVTQIYNGVDAARFHPRGGARRLPGGPAHFQAEDLFLVGTVGRMQGIKNHPLLVRAFLRLLERRPDRRDKLRLVMVGEGPLRAECENLVAAAGAGDLAWFAGERADTPELMRGLDLFVQPSRAEGVSNTILEAMASGLAVVATRVGGNPELVEQDRSGLLVPLSGGEEALAEAIGRYLDQPELSAAHGQAARARVERDFRIEVMTESYLRVYDEELGLRPGAFTRLSARRPR